LHQAEESLKTAQTAFSSAQTALADMAEKFGPKGEWKKLEGTCVEKDLGEYTYELCWFGDVKQKSNKGGATNNLGYVESCLAMQLARPLTPHPFTLVPPPTASSAGGTPTARPRRAPSSSTRRSFTTTAPSAGTARTGASRSVVGETLAPLRPEG
jgi:hypothetical protein